MALTGCPRRIILSIGTSSMVKGRVAKQRLGALRVAMAAAASEYNFLMAKGVGKGPAVVMLLWGAAGGWGGWKGVGRHRATHLARALAPRAQGLGGQR